MDYDDIDEMDESGDFVDISDACRYCGSPMVYEGVDDGGGPYGSSVCDIYTCPNCNWSEERNCIEVHGE